jgi:hypothetical protein
MDHFLPELFASPGNVDIEKGRPYGSILMPATGLTIDHRSQFLQDTRSAPAQPVLCRSPPPLPSRADTSAVTTREETGERSSASPSINTFGLSGYHSLDSGSSYISTLASDHTFGTAAQTHSGMAPPAESTSGGTKIRTQTFTTNTHLEASSPTPLEQSEQPEGSPQNSSPDLEKRDMKAYNWWTSWLPTFHCVNLSFWEITIWFIFISSFVLVPVIISVWGVIPSFLQP